MKLFGLIGATAASVAFQMSVDAGYVHNFVWLIPWCWGASAAAWVAWGLWHDKLVNGWLIGLHRRMGKGVYPLRILICLVVFFVVTLCVSKLTRSTPRIVSAQTQPSPPPSGTDQQKKKSVTSKGSQTQKNSGGTNVQQQQNNSGGNNVQQNGNGNVGVTGNQNEVNIGQQNNGWLKPASDPDPRLPLMCGTRNGFTVYAADSVFTGLAFPMTLLSVKDKPLVTIDKNKDGEMALTADIFNPENPAKIVASIEENEFHVNGNQVAWIKTPDKSTLIVIDQFKTEILRVHYMNDHAMEFSGILFAPDIPGVPIVINKTGLHFAGVGFGANCYTSTNFPQQPAVIAVLSTQVAGMLNIN